MLTLKHLLGGIGVFSIKVRDHVLHAVFRNIVSWWERRSCLRLFGLIVLVHGERHEETGHRLLLEGGKLLFIELFIGVRIVLNLDEGGLVALESS